MSASGPYAADCRELFGRLVEERAASRRTTNSGDGGAAPAAADGDAGVSGATRDRSLPGAWRYHYLETKRIWTEEFKEPFVLPGTGYIPMDSAHPAELAMSGAGVLGCFEEGAPPGGGSWRAGAQALYLTWLRDPRLQQPLSEAQAAADAAAARAAAPPPPPPPSGLFACFGCGGGDVVDQAPAGPGYRPPGPPLTQGQLRHAAAAFSAFRGLPSTPAHPYWRMLEPVGADEVQETGPEGEQLEVFAAPGRGASAQAQAQMLANELGDDVEVAIADPLEWAQR
jgi:hypothetical protein